MAWTWTDVTKIKNGLFLITATEDTSGETISFRVHKDDVTPADIVTRLQAEVDALNAADTQKTNLLNTLINNVDISGVV